MKHKLFSSAALLLLAFGAVAAARDAVSIAWKPKAGAVYKYKFKAVATVQGQELEFTYDDTQTISDVKPDAITVKDKETDIAASFAGQPAPAGQLPSDINETTTMKPNGEMTDHKSDQPDNSPRLDALNQFIYPDHPVNANDSWKFIGKGDKAKGTYDYTATYTYMGQETVSGVSTYKVTLDYKETNAPDKPVTATGTLWLSAEDGQPVKMDASVKNADLGAPLGSADLQVSLVKQ